MEEKLRGMKMGKKAAIITRHSIPNYGSFLQAMATERLISDLGYDEEIIDYRRADEKSEALIRYYCRRNPGIVRVIYYKLFWRFSDYLRERVFAKARNRYLKLSREYDSSSLAQTENRYDVFITGSDQVWNVVGSGDTIDIDENYFWEKIGKDHKIISYAASFGDKTLSSEDQRRCSLWLSKYDAISVREDSGVALVKQLGYDAVQVLDPTLMVEQETWISLARSVKKRRKPYMLAYNLHASSEMGNLVKSYGKELNLDIVNIISTFRFSHGKNIFCPSIEKFLSLFMNADFIIADSFHAIAFSIIFRVPFAVKMPKQYSARLESILKEFSFLNRVVNDTADYRIINENIDWEAVEAVLEKNRQYSMNWLREALRA